MSIDHKALLAAHEIAGHCTVSSGVRGIRADLDGGFSVVSDPPTSEGEFIAQMIAGSLAEIILTHGEHIALLKLRADKSVLNTAIGEYDWVMVQHIPHAAVIRAAERIAPHITLALARMGKSGLAYMGEALDSLEAGETFSLEVANV